MLAWLWWSFQMTQLAVSVLGLAFLLWTIWREYHLGNDLTYWQLARLMCTIAIFSSLGVLLPLLVWVAYRTGDVEIERGVEFQNSSVYEQVGTEKVLLSGSKSAKVLRNLTADWGKDW